VARTCISYQCVPCHQWCIHRTSLVVKKAFVSVPVAVNNSSKVGPLVFLLQIVVITEKTMKRPILIIVFQFNIYTEQLRAFTTLSASRLLFAICNRNSDKQISVCGLFYLQRPKIPRIVLDSYHRIKNCTQNFLNKKLSFAYSTVAFRTCVKLYMACKGGQVISILVQCSVIACCELSLRL
jgi:hypothetical protein